MSGKCRSVGITPWVLFALLSPLTMAALLTPGVADAVVPQHAVVWGLKRRHFLFAAAATAASPLAVGQTSGNASKALRFDPADFRPTGFTFDPEAKPKEVIDQLILRNSVHHFPADGEILERLQQRLGTSYTQPPLSAPWPSGANRIVGHPHTIVVRDFDRSILSAVINAGIQELLSARLDFDTSRQSFLVDEPGVLRALGLKPGQHLSAIQVDKPAYVEELSGPNWSNSDQRSWQYVSKGRGPSWNMRLVSARSLDGLAQGAVRQITGATIDNRFVAVEPEQSNEILRRLPVILWTFNPALAQDLDFSALDDFGWRAPAEVSWKESKLLEGVAPHVARAYRARTRAYGVVIGIPEDGDRIAWLNQLIDSRAIYVPPPDIGR